MWCDLFILLSCVVALVKAHLEIEEHFGKCDLTSADIDNCLKDAINDMRPFFKEGLQEYGIRPFEPIYFSDIVQERSLPFMHYRLVLRNVTEAGWSISQFTNVRTDFPKHQMQITQFFPDKPVDGWYEIEGTFLGIKFHNKRPWNMRLFDFVETLTISRKPVNELNGSESEHPPIKVKWSFESCKKVEMHIGLVEEPTIVENMLDWVITSAWRQWLVLLSPLLNDLVDTALTGTFNDNFQYFPFESIFNNKTGQ